MFKKLFSKKGSANAAADNSTLGDSVQKNNSTPNQTEILTEAQFLEVYGARVAERVRKEYSFYRDCFHFCVKIIMILAVAFPVYVGLDLYKVATHKPTIETFFVTNENNQIIPLKPVNVPLPDGDVINWATESIVDIYTLGPLDFRKRVSVDFQKYFTPEGLKGYRQAIAPRLAQLTANAQSMTATPASSPTIINQGVLDQRYYWQIMLPIQVTYVRTGETVTELRRVVMNVVRADQTRYPTGLAFTSIDESEPINSNKTR